MLASERVARATVEVRLLHAVTTRRKTYRAGDVVDAPLDVAAAWVQAGIATYPGVVRTAMLASGQPMAPRWEVR